MAGYSRRTGLVTGLAVAMALGACGGDSSGPGSSTISQQQADAIGALASAQMSDVAMGLSSFSSGSLGSGFFAPTTPTGRLVRLMSRAAGPAASAQLGAVSTMATCTPSMSDPTDTDGDGIEDDNTITFTAANCTEDDGQGNVTVVTGSVHIVDTDDVDTQFGFTITINNFQISSTSNSQTVSIAMNGSYSGDVGTSQASSAQNLTLNASSGGQSASVHFNHSASFTPTAGQTIDIGTGSFPSGSWSFAGSFGVNSPSEGNFSFTIATTTPLAFDGSCFSDPPFTSGAVQVVISANNDTGFNLTYGGCGVAPVITAFGDVAA